ncbi:glycosyltransferase [Lujinxingia vulgaris]|uniref:Glycosyltransferase n=1 Tax=Lujinxingia vulgaris TaxID=2600176 RepID=A0A5C6X3C0_9DELT|nr:glycosyltransferase [Lujinxingia vulgaris]TXD34770.1 glycosyltransferase [Lujinxingia vulgaris]
MSQRPKTIAESRVLLYIPSLRGGGAERSMINLARGLVEAGAHVDLVVSIAESDYADELPPEVSLHILDVRRVLKVIPHLARQIRRLKPDIIVSRPYRSNLLMLAAAELARSRAARILIVDNTTTQEMALASGTARGRLTNLVDLGLMRRLYPRAFKIVVVSRGSADDLVHLLELPDAMVEVIYNPVEIDHIQTLAEEPVEHPWLDDAIPLLMTAGRLAKQKDHPTLIRALHKLNQTRPTRLMIFGQGPDQAALEALIDELDLQDRVALMGFTPNPFPFMAAADAFVLSSAWEGLGNVLIEAMAVGTPVLSTDCPHGPAELLASGLHGELTPVGDATALAHAIERTLDAPRDPERLRRRAAEFDRPAILERYLSIFNDALTR